MPKWAYYHALVGDNPNQLTVGVMEYVSERNSALDLGAGNLRDSKFLLSQGFKRVVAVDESAESIEFSTTGIELEILPIQDYLIEPDSFDLVISCNTLFFVQAENVRSLFRNVLAGLRNGGVFACNVLGPEDSWVEWGESVSSFGLDDLKILHEGFEVIGVQEDKHTDSSHASMVYMPPKHWHLRSMILRKP